MSRQPERQVYLENWQEQLEETVKLLADGLGSLRDSLEAAAMRCDVDQLREMKRQVREVPPLQRRKQFSSLILRAAVDSATRLPEDVIHRVAELFEIYRRFCTRLEWRN